MLSKDDINNIIDHLVSLNEDAENFIKKMKLNFRKKNQ